MRVTISPTANAIFHFARLTPGASPLARRKDQLCVRRFFQRMSDRRLALQAAVYPCILIMVHIKSALETQYFDSLLGMEMSGCDRDGAYAIARFVFVLSLVKHDGQHIRAMGPMNCKSEQPAACSDCKGLQACRAAAIGAGRANDTHSI